MFLVRGDDVPAGESARDAAEVRVERAGMVSVGVRHLPAQDVPAEERVEAGIEGRGQTDSSSSLAASVERWPSKATGGGDGDLVVSEDRA